MIRKSLSFLALSLLIGTVGSLAAADIRFELGFGWTLVAPAMNATYVNQYQPTLTPPDRYVASAADQTVRFKAKTTYGMNGFFNVLFTENVGLQILADYQRPGIGGSNAPYLIEMQFLAFDDTPETYSRSIDWTTRSGTSPKQLSALTPWPVSASPTPSRSAFRPGRASSISKAKPVTSAIPISTSPLSESISADRRDLPHDRCVRPADEVRHERGRRGGL